MSKDMKSIDTNLGKILKLEKEEQKFDEQVERDRKKELNQKERNAKRKRADMFKKIKSDKKKNADTVNKTGNLFEKLLGGLTGILGSIKGLLGGIGGLITAGFSGLGLAGTIGSALTGVAALLKPALGMVLKGVTTALGAVLGPIKTAIGALVLKAGGWAALGLLGAKAAILVGAPVALAAGAGLLNERVQDNRVGGGDAAQLRRDINRAQADMTDGKSRRGTRDARASDEYKRLQALEDELYESNRIKDREIREATTTSGSGRAKTTTTDAAAVREAQRAHEARVAEIRRRFEKPVKRQLGGHINVPGIGEGDKVPMMLPEGSFVLNKMASMHFQNGGMIPTLLEPGEKVFMPGDWDSSISTLNSIIPRFQTGGLVEASHPDTGAGWSIGPDAQGRPSVFSREAAEALQKAIKDSDGAVKTSDITSSTRSPEKNAAVGGVPNSNHLSGMAVDIHGTSKAWLKKNGHKYGWKNLVYSGHDGHFDFIGGGSPLRPASSEGDEVTADPDSDKGGGGVQGLMNSVGDTLNVIGGFGKAFLKGFREGGSGAENFDSVMGMLTGGMSNMIGDLFGGITDMFGGGDDQQSSSSSSGSNARVEGNAGDMMAGAKMLQEAGFPNRGAAYLAGNIQQESSWDGQRDWGEVMGDGSLRNGGLVSWMNNASGHSRLTKIEKFLGKKIQDASDGEQINAMIWEMKKRNPEAYQTFMNPKATDAQLRSASRAYWGYGHEGGRYGYAEQILEQMKQTGGVIGRQRGGSIGRISSQQMERLRQAQASHNNALVIDIKPVVVYEDEPTPQIATTSGMTVLPPDLPDGPGSDMAADYFYNLSLGVQ